MTQPDREAKRTADRQLGLLTHEQAKKAGFSKSSIHRRVASGAWERVFPRVFKLWDVGNPWKQRVVAVGLWAGPTGTISHRSAAAWWDLDLCEPGPLEISVPGSRRPPSPDVTVHQSSIPRVDRGLSGAVWITTTARTLLDLASCVSPEFLEPAVHSALRRKQVTLDRLWTLIERNERRHGVATLRSLIDQLSSPTVTESVLETKVLRLLRKQRLDPCLQFEVFDGPTFVARVDLAFPEWKVAIEVDGFKYHSSRADLRRDHRRLNHLQRLGWTVLFVSAEDLEEPLVLVSTIRALLGQARLHA